MDAQSQHAAMPDDPGAPPPAASRLGLALLRAVARRAATMPLPRALALGRGLGVLIGSGVRYRRREAAAALARCLPERTPPDRAAILSRMYRHIGMNLVESARLAGGQLDQVQNLVEFSQSTRVAEELKRGRGALILTAHFGNWDLLSVRTPMAGLPLTIISKELKNNAINSFWMDMRARLGLHIVPRRNSYRACRVVLKRNELVGFILDQNMIRTEGIFVDFFGRPACTTPGLAFMAAQAAAPVFPIFLVRDALDPARHTLLVQDPLEPPPDREPATIQAATQQYTRIIEAIVRQHPDHWIWIHRRWRTQPDLTQKTQIKLDSPAENLDKDQ